jgi:hypothetical protein
MPAVRRCEGLLKFSVGAEEKRTGICLYFLNIR